MKSYPIIFSYFSIAGIKKQYEWQNTEVKQTGTAHTSSELITTIRDIENAHIGCKTETRRLTNLKEINKNPDDWQFAGFEPSNSTYGFSDFKADGHTKWIKCPWGAKGSEIWVREVCANLNEDFPKQEPYWVYKADLTHEYEYGVVTWRSPMLMPKKASRITLINEGVTVERLHDITKEGAIREGFKKTVGGNSKVYGFPVSAVDNFKNTWIAIHGEESWLLNPWVWVLKFSVKEFN